MKIKTVVFFVLLGVIIYSGASLGLPWVRNRMFQADIEEHITAVGIQTLAYTRNQVLESARLNQVPVTEKNLIVSRDEGSGLVVIEAKYSVTVELPLGLYTKVWEFHPRAERIVPQAPGLTF